MAGAAAGGGAMGAAISGCATTVGCADGLTVVTVSAGSDGAATAGVEAAGVSVGADEVPVADTEPLSPPPRMMPVVPIAMNRMTPAMPATHIHLRSMLSSSYSAMSAYSSSSGYS